MMILMIMTSLHNTYVYVYIYDRRRMSISSSSWAEDAAFLDDADADED